MRRLSLIQLSITLLFACGAAAATESQQLATDANSSCPDSATASAERSDSGDPDAATATPVRHTEKAKTVVTPRSSTRSAVPRWHSFLPGMFR
ncbi:MAG: hypothetical protein ABIQ62_03855 [Thermomonas sp.]